MLKKISLFTIIAALTCVLISGCSSDESQDNSVDFESELAEQTADTERYKDLPYLGDWYLGTINTGETDENGIVWSEPDYLETLTIDASGLIIDTINDEALEGYIVPVEIEESEDSETITQSAFSAVFFYEDDKIEIHFVYYPEDEYLVVTYDGDTVACVYFHGKVDTVTMLEDGTYIDEDGNPVEISEEEIINTNEE